MSYSLDNERLDLINQILVEELIDIGVESAILIDMAGNIIATLDNGQCMVDVFSLAALAAANFGAVSSMARLIGEEDFTLMFHRGEKESIHLNRINENFLLISIFDSSLSLGYLRLKVAEVIEKLAAIWQDSGESDQW